MSNQPQYVFDLTGVYGPQIILMSPDGTTSSSLYIDNDGVLRAAESIITVPAALSLWSRNGSFGGLTVNDHFISSTPAGSQNWTTTTNGSSAASSIYPASVGHPGVVQLSTGKTATGRCSLTQTQTGIMFGSGSYRFDTCIKLPDLSNTVQTYITRIGFGNNTGAGDVTDGVYFENSGSEWFMKTANNTIRTTTYCSQDVVTDWTTLSILVTGTETASFYINGTKMGSTYTNIPTNRSTGIFQKIESTKGTTPKTILIDATSVSYQYSS